ncbi:MAG: hypothetical protein ACKO66_09295, partial [Flavobacteriales bacterium]
MSFFLALVYSGVAGAVDVITVQTDMPTELQAGGKRSVQVTINKDQVQGFSKLEFTLPNGISAVAGDTKGGSFTFTGQKAKFIWMTLPEQSSFSISYEIQVAENVAGDFQIQGVFSYVNQNKREDLKLTPQRFHVRGIDSPQSLEGLVESNPNVKTEPELLELICSREVTRISDTEFLVRLIVVNNKIEGFGKILELLPDNCTTERENDGGAIITQDMHSIKFVWFEVPLSESFEVSYRVFCTSPEAMLTIRGELSYTEGGKPVTDKIQQAAETNETTVAEQTSEDPKANETQPTEVAADNQTNGNADASQSSNPNDGQDTASSDAANQDATPVKD